MNRILKLQHKLVREDPYVIDMTKATDLSIEDIEKALEDIEKQFWFDTMTWGADILAKQLDIKIPANTSIEDKRSILEARWKNSGKSDIYLLQAIADSWKNGEIEVGFVNGKIQIKFIGEYGAPSDINSLKREIDLAKPAHLGVFYLFKYLLIRDIHEVLTLEQMESLTLDKFASGGEPIG